MSEPPANLLLLPTHSEQKMVTPSHEEQQVSIQSLLPGRTYQFRVVANTNFGIGESSQPLEVSTQPEVNIAGPPRNVDATARSHKEIYVHWSAPAVTNGEILKYRVYYSEVRAKTIQSKDVTNSPSLPTG